MNENSFLDRIKKLAGIKPELQMNEYTKFWHDMLVLDIATNLYPKDKIESMWQQPEDPKEAELWKQALQHAVTMVENYWDIDKGVGHWLPNWYRVPPYLKQAKKLAQS